MGDIGLYGGVCAFPCLGNSRGGGGCLRPCVDPGNCQGGGGILRFCHERGQIKRWGAVRHVIVSGISMHDFFIFICSQKKRFSYVCTCHVRSTFFDVFFLLKKWFDPKVPQKCLGPLWDHPRPIPDHSGPIPTKNHLKTEIKNHMEIIYKIL